LQFLHKINEFLQRQPRYISWLIKGVLVVIFGLLLWFEIFNRDNIADMKTAFNAQLRGENRFWLLGVLILLPFNWAAETRKWLPLIRKTEYLSFWKAYKAVLAGVTFSMFTPNRVGEFGGRILFLKWDNVLKGIFSTIVASFAQQIILISFGFLGFAYFLVAIWGVDKLVVQGIVFLGACLIGLLVFIFLHLEVVVPVFKKIRVLYRFPRLIKNINIIRQYNRRVLFWSLFWAFVRYLIYGTQYYMMLQFFGIHAPILRGASCIATIYLLQTSIPLPPVVGLLARGEVALQVWGLFSENKVSILAATFGIWIINLIFPAFLGLIFIINANLLKSLGYVKRNHQPNTSRKLAEKEH
jgi:uncharacterized membrane protein YbhN (UPF0104 family)